MNHIVNIKVKNRVAVWDDTSSEIICDNRDYTVTVDFDDEWSEIETKTARVYESGQYTDIVFTGNSFTAPPVHDTLIALIGIFSGDITTTPAIVPCKKSILSNGGEIADPPDDVYKQIIDMIESGMLKGEPGYAPTVSVTDITGGHRVTITDADGEKSFDVMDGQGGEGGNVQPDWNQNDESQPDYVKNRTHYEIPPKFDIRWDGDMTGKFALPLDDLGMPGIYLVKVSDLVLSADDIAGATQIYYDGTEETIYSSSVDAESFPGAYKASYIASVYNQEILNSALGLPDGTITNGMYFTSQPEYGFYIAGFVGVPTIVKLDEKYLPDTYASKEYVDNLITGAIGGSY